MNIPKIIRKEMERQGISQRQLSFKADVTQSKISTYLNGHAGITAETLARLMDALKLEIKPKKGR